MGARRPWAWQTIKYAAGAMTSPDVPLGVHFRLWASRAVSTCRPSCAERLGRVHHEKMVVVQPHRLLALRPREVQLFEYGFELVYRNASFVSSPPPAFFWCLLSLRGCPRSLHPPCALPAPRVVTVVLLGRRTFLGTTQTSRDTWRT